MFIQRLGGSEARGLSWEEQLCEEGGEVNFSLKWIGLILISGWVALARVLIRINEVMVRGKEDETTVVLYFDSWPKVERCVGLPLKQVLSFPMHCDVITDILLSNVICIDINSVDSTLCFTMFFWLKHWQRPNPLETVQLLARWCLWRVLSLL